MGMQNFIAPDLHYIKGTNFAGGDDWTELSVNASGVWKLEGIVEPARRL